jgi:transposase-like protein
VGQVWINNREAAHIPNTCPICGSDDTHKRGYVRNRNGKRARYFCNTHRGSFSDPDTPNILIFDIETLPLVAYVWGAWEQNLSVDSVIKDWCVLSWSAKWLDGTLVISDALTPSEARTRNDKRLMRGLWKLLDKADIVVAHNGKKFDVRRVNARFLYHRIKPPSSYKVLDTYTESKGLFDLTFQKQEWLARYLNEPRKLDTNLALWIACDKGDADAIKKMREYNEGDVIGLERIYKRLVPYFKNHPNITLYRDNENPHECPRCSGQLKRIGLFYAARKKYQEYRCAACGGVSHGTKAIR